jgi:asparagine synthase (glutamine-hydrolysing)
MCGISGIFHFDPAQPIERSALSRMSSVMRHRGPDDAGDYVDFRVGLVFNRLSIIDLDGGHQPMSNEDGSVWIVFNGEIYNFLEIREQLLGRGHRFRTRSDTETIVHAWEEFGEDCVHKLRGMFAFVIWDRRQQLLFGARDRLGIKPLYYFADSAQFAFASEMKSLLELPGSPRTVDHGALEEFLRYRYVIAPETMIAGIKKLPPGHTFTVNRKGVTIKRYWDMPLVAPEPVSETKALEQLDWLLSDVVRMHLVADVPLGAFLSGGLDSSCVVALMSRLGVNDIKTFSIGYDSPESELDYARKVARHLKTDHHELRLTATGFRDIFPKITWHMDEPVGDTASIPLYYLARFARETVTVALSGEGADEIFGGYPIYRRMLAFEKANRFPLARPLGRVINSLAGDTKIGKYADMLGRPLEWRYGGVGGLFSPGQAKRLLSPKSAPLNHVSDAYARCAGLSPFERMSYVDTTTWLPDDLLVKADRMSMANSLELRVPFLDHRLVEFGARLPHNLKIRRAISKYLLKRWAEPLLPGHIIHRTKRGFPVPTKAWFRGDLAGFARESLLARNGAVRTFLCTAEVEHLFEQHRIEDRSTQIYSLLVFQEWYAQFVRRTFAQGSAEDFVGPREAGQSVALINP